ncbi:MAG: hypothetical protein ACE5HT_08890 [Gemmatimonadales bacterium]
MTEEREVFRPSYPPLFRHRVFMERGSDGSGQRAGQIALGAFLTMRLIDWFVDGDLDRAATAYQIDATRGFVADVPCTTEEPQHLLAIVNAAGMALDGSDNQPLVEPLLAYADWLASVAEPAEALDVLDTVIQLCGAGDGENVVVAQLRRGTLFLACSEFAEADNAFAIAAGLGRDLHRLQARIGSACVSRNRGELADAERALEEVRIEAHDLGETSAEVQALNELARVFQMDGRSVASVTTAYNAFQLAANSFERQETLSLLGSLLVHVGNYDAAEDAFNLVLREEPGHKKRMYVVMDLLRLAGLRKDRVGFERRRAECNVLAQDAALWEVRDIEVTLAIAYARLGAFEKTGDHMNEAVRLTQEFHLEAYAGPDSSALSDLSTIAPLHDSDETFPASQESWPAFSEVAEELRALLLAG